MKKIFTLLVFLIVTVNAAAQYNGYLNVAAPDRNQLKDEAQQYGNRGSIENGRLNVCGYVFYKNKTWNWIDNNTTIQGYGTSTTWSNKDVFKGSTYFFGNESSYVAYNSAGNATKLVRFYIKNCSGIDVFLERFEGTTWDNCSSFYIKAFPSSKDAPSSSSDFSNVADVQDVVNLDKNGTRQFTSSISGLDNKKIYKIELTIPSKTYLYEISFVINNFETTIGDSNWGTMYLDFPVTIPTDHPELKVFTVATLDKDKNICTLFPITTGSIPANTGVLLYEPNVTTHETIKFVETGGLDPVDNWLSGTAADNFTVREALEGKPSTTKVLTLGRSGGKLGFYIYKDNDPDLILAKNKAFLIWDYSTPTSGGEVKGFYISGFNELTGIQTMESESTESGNWYSLQGVRLNARPTQRGIYLNNGKKVFVK